MYIERIEIQNFKSLVNVNLDLGRINVFIGPNGAGKTAILEALGIISSAMVERLDDRLLSERGVRLGTPYLYKSSFISMKTPACMKFSIIWVGDDNCKYRYSFSLNAPMDQAKYTWKFHAEALVKMGELHCETVFGRSGRSKNFDEYDNISISRDRSMYGLLRQVVSESFAKLNMEWGKMDITKQIEEYGIYSPNTLMLRGLATDENMRTPVGLYGGRLADATNELIGQLRQKQVAKKFEEIKLCNELLFVNGWYTGISAGARNQQILSKSVSSPNRVLKFTDKFMSQSRNTVTAYDANEGALYSLFLACLLFHTDAPSVFAIDNFDYGSNPWVAKRQAEVFCEHFKSSNRTVLLTTHNPLVLDGLDLANDSICLFAVDRKRNGQTFVTKVKPDPDLMATEGINSLSDLWLTGRLGAMPKI